MFHFNPDFATREVQMLLAKIDEFKGKWRSYGTLAPERLFALRRVATIESIGSSTRIEGSQLSNREVEGLLARLEIKSFVSRDEQEVAGYAELMELIYQNWELIPFNENHIKQFHRDLLTYSSKDVAHRGNYKTTSNRVSAFDAEGKEVAVIFETATPYDTPRLMAELVDWYNNVKNDEIIHPLICIAVFVVVFLEIHPFKDGNGRLSRILTTLLLLQAGYAYVPYSSLESVIEQNKQGYYLALRQTQGTIRTDAPLWAPWITYFLRALRSQVQNLEKKVTHEQHMLATLPETSIRILELTAAQGRVTIQDIVVANIAKRDTAKLHLRKLTASGHLLMQGMGRNVSYLMK